MSITTAVEAGTDLIEYYFAQGWTDGLPVVPPTPAKVEAFVAALSAVREVAISDEVAIYIVDIARATRVSPSLALGVSPRGATALMATSRAWAWLATAHVMPTKVRAMPARPGESPHCSWRT